MIRLRGGTAHSLDGGAFPIPVMGKTGTTSDFTDAWFVGYTPYLTTAVWMGNAEAPVEMRNVGGLSSVTGGTFPAQMWGAFNRDYHQDKPVKAFNAGYATDDDLLATIATVDREHGYLLDPHTAAAWHVGEAFQGDRPQVVVGTAHPAKFGDAVEKAVGRPPAIPPGFEDLSTRPERVTVIDPDPSELDRFIR